LQHCKQPLLLQLAHDLLFCFSNVCVYDRLETVNNKAFYPIKTQEIAIFIVIVIAIFVNEHAFIMIMIHTCKPALAERDTAFAFAFPESLPALPPA